MPINKNEITKELFAKAMKCETADELMALAKAEGFEIMKDEAPPQHCGEWCCGPVND